MKPTKFNEISAAYRKARKDFLMFESDCRSFSIELVKKWRDYLNIPAKQFSLYQIDGANKFVLVPPSLINAISPAEGPYWQFGIGLTVCCEDEETECCPASEVDCCSMSGKVHQEIILVHILVRKDADGKYYVKFGHEPKEFLINRNREEGYQSFFNFLHKEIVTSYQVMFQKFIGQRTIRKLGFVLKEEKEPDKKEEQLIAKESKAETSIKQEIQLQT